MDTNHTKPKILPNSAALLRELPADASTYPAGCNVHIFPDGFFQANDGRPARITEGKLTHWKMDQAVADALIAAATRPVLFDRDHESIYGTTAAAGWIVALHYESGQGLFGRCEWVGDAAEEIAGKVYRYLSPYFEFDPATGAVVRLISVALTNDPALNDLGAVALKHQSQESNMPEPDTNVAALTKQVADLNSNVAALTSENADLKSQVATLTKEKADAAAAADKKQHADLLQAALTDGRLTPAQKGWAEKQSLAALTEYLEATNPLAMLNKQHDGKDAGTGTAALTKEDLEMCSRMNIKPEDYAKTKAGN